MPSDAAHKPDVSSLASSCVTASELSVAAKHVLRCRSGATLIAATATKYIHASDA